MSTANLSLAAYRDRRSRRLAQAIALHGGDPARQRLIQHLWNVASTLDADRVAALWVDEYGSGLVHTHCVLDLTTQPPRDDFRVDPLRLAWNEGVPGLIDLPDSVRAHLPFLGGVQSACYVALGSDGTRAWFLTADSRSTREPVSGRALDELMFEAGEVAAVVLHMDLAEQWPLQMAVGGQTATGLRERRRPPGWHVLKDLEERESEPGLERRIGTRFAVAQVIHTMIGEDFVLDRDTLDAKIAELRRAFDVVDADDSEREAWERVAAALEVEDRLELARAALALAERVEGIGHLNGALELFRVSYAVAVSAWAFGEAIDAARFLGRASRKLADWDASFKWYSLAREMAEAVRDRVRFGHILDGVATNHRNRGNLPKARSLLESVLSIANEEDDAELTGLAHHNVMTLEKLAGHPEKAIPHGWEAVRTYPSERDRLRALTDLAWAFVQVGELTAAEDAYSIVAHRVDEYLYKVYALDALAYIEARRGRRDGFERRLEAVDAMDWQQGETFMVAELLFYRGNGYLTLGDPDEAEVWFLKARQFAEDHGNNQITFDAEAALGKLEDARNHAPARKTDIQSAAPPVEGIAGIRRQLNEMRAVALAL